MTDGFATNLPKGGIDYSNPNLKVGVYPPRIGETKSDHVNFFEIFDIVEARHGAMYKEIMNIGDRLLSLDSPSGPLAEYTSLKEKMRIGEIDIEEAYNLARDALSWAEAFHSVLYNDADSFI